MVAVEYRIRKLTLPESAARDVTHPQMVCPPRHLILASNIAKRIFMQVLRAETSPDGVMRGAILRQACISRWRTRLSRGWERAMQNRQLVLPSATTRILTAGCD